LKTVKVSFPSFAKMSTVYHGPSNIRTLSLWFT